MSRCSGPRRTHFGLKLSFWKTTGTSSTCTSPCALYWRQLVDVFAAPPKLCKTKQCEVMSLLLLMQTSCAASRQTQHLKSVCPLTLMCAHTFPPVFMMFLRKICWACGHVKKKIVSLFWEIFTQNPMRKTKKWWWKWWKRFQNCSWKHLIYKQFYITITNNFSLSVLSKTNFNYYYFFFFTQLASECVSSFGATCIVFFKGATQSHVLVQYEESESFGM